MGLVDGVRMVATPGAPPRRWAAPLRRPDRLGLDQAKQVLGDVAAARDGGRLADSGASPSASPFTE